MNLRLKLIVPLIALILVTLLSFQLILLPSLHESLEEDFDQGQLAIVQALGTAIAPNLQINNFAELDGVLNEHLRLNPNWIRLNVYDDHGNQVFP